MSFVSRYNKQTKQLLPNANKTVSNDWDGGMDIHLIYSFQTGSILCLPLQPFEMKEKLTNAHFAKATCKYLEQQKALKKLIDNALEDDNPILMLIHLK